MIAALPPMGGMLVTATLAVANDTRY